MLKILYLILFFLIYKITDVILLVVVILQAGLNLFTGEPSESVKNFGKSLGEYLKQISEFLSYASEEKPFPFSDWPEVNSEEEEELVQETQVAIENEDSADSSKK